MSALVRYNGEWIRVVPKPFEPERQTYEIAWNLIHDPSTTPAAAYRKWYKTEQEKYKAIIKTIEECHQKKQPILVGTVNIEKSEHISKLLNKIINSISI
jgi:hypothetical protein